jgi:hypothetical protein
MFPSLASGDGRRHTDLTASIAALIGIDPIDPTSSS